MFFLRPRTDERTIHRQAGEAIAAQVLLHCQNGFLDGAAALIADDQAFLPAVNTWHRLESLALPEEGQEAALTQAVAQWLRDSGGQARVFALRFEGGAVSVHFGNGGGALQAAMDANQVEARLTCGGWPLPALPFAGLALGGGGFSRLADTAAAAGLSDGYLAVVCMPVSGEESARLLARDEQLSAQLAPQRALTRVYGQMTRREEPIERPHIARALALLEAETKLLQAAAGEGLVRLAVLYGASTESERAALEGIVRGCSVAGDGAEPLRTVQVLGQQLAITIPAFRLPVGETLYAASLCTIPTAAGACTPPLRSRDGYYVNQHQKDMAFPVTAPVQDQDAIDLGSSIVGRQRARIPLALLQRHAFVVGQPGSGKTTTVQNLLIQLAAHGIPFLVLEGAKREHVGLLGRIPSLRVVGSGADSLPFQFNPLMPEDGSLIESHMDAVVRAMVCSMPCEEPIPTAIRGVLQTAYAAAGWHYGETAFDDSARPWPTLAQCAELVDDYVDDSARYGKENRANLKAAVRLRFETLSQGAVGRLTSVTRGFQARELLAGPTVVELAGLGQDAAVFLTTVLLFKLQAYLALQPEADCLRRVIVLEEAHRLFSAGPEQSAQTQALQQMMAEIRASGSGMVIIDQRVDTMPPSVLADTAVKIVHCVASPADAQLLAGAMGLNDQQTATLRLLAPGECLLGLSGLDRVQYVKADMPPAGRPITAACVLCVNRARCRRRQMASLLAGADPAALRYHVARVFSIPYSPAWVGPAADEALQQLGLAESDKADRLCALGLLAAGAGKPLELARIAVTNYLKYMERSSDHGV